MEDKGLSLLIASFYLKMEQEQNSTFTPLTNKYNHNLSILKDEHDLIRIENKTPIVKNIGKIVHGETHSNILTFEINRFFDGADLSTKGIWIIVKNDVGVSVEPATNLEYNEEFIRFSWVMSNFATSKKTVTAAIEFYGVIDDEQDYSLKTVPFTIQIEDSLDSADMDVYTLLQKNLYVDLTNRIMRIEDKIWGTNEDSLHIHNNKSTLDKLGESDCGKLLFDGKEITNGTGDSGDVIGNDGKSAYQIAVDNGFTGTEIEWLESLKGVPGKDADINSITPEIIGAANKEHAHGDMKTITFSSTEPTTIAENEIVMVYETEEA